LLLLIRTALGEFSSRIKVGNLLNTVYACDVVLHFESAFEDKLLIELILRAIVSTAKLCQTYPVYSPVNFT
jgi:hypothetical protein